MPYSPRSAIARSFRSVCSHILFPVFAARVRRYSGGLPGIAERAVFLVALLTLVACGDLLNPEGRGGAPRPHPGDRILYDQRAGKAHDIQAAADLASAKRGLDYVHPEIGFATDFDGRGTRAFVHSFRATSTCKDREVGSHKYLPHPLPRELYVSWKMHMGRTETGGGIGDVGYFDVTSDRCVQDGAGRKMMRFLRDVPERGAEWSFDLLWSGPAPASPHLSVFGGHKDVTENRWLEYRPEGMIGRVVEHTIHVRAESAPGAGDGLLQVWVDGQRVGRWENITTGDVAFHRLQWPMVIRGPVASMTEYWWDMVVWEP